MEFITAPHWQEVPHIKWRWKNFRASEFACRGEPGRHSLRVAVTLLDKLQTLREAMNRPMVVTSGYRSPGYNATLPGAAPNSTHVQGLAADISMGNFLGDELAFYLAAKRIGFTGFGFYPEERNNFMHIDLGPARFWGNPKPWGITVG